MDFFHDEMRTLQDRYEGRAVADRLVQHRLRQKFNDADKALIETAPFFFLATASETSVDCSFKGGEPGFVRIVGETELVWPDYDGNRMYRSLGNIERTSQVGLLFLSFEGGRFDGSAARLRINGRARVVDSDPEQERFPGARRLIRLEADHIFPNCPRYIPQMHMEAESVYAPREGHTPPEPEWKSKDWVKDVFDGETGA